MKPFFLPYSTRYQSPEVPVTVIFSLRLSSTTISYFVPGPSRKFALPAFTYAALSSMDFTLKLGFGVGAVPNSTNSASTNPVSFPASTRYHSSILPVTQSGSSSSSSSRIAYSVPGPSRKFALPAFKYAFLSSTGSTVYSGVGSGAGDGVSSGVSEGIGRADGGRVHLRRTAQMPPPALPPPWNIPAQGWLSAEW